MAAFQIAMGYSATPELDELNSVQDDTVVNRATLLTESDWPNTTAIELDDSATGNDTTCIPAKVHGRNNDVQWGIFYLDMQGVTPSKDWIWIRTQNGSGSRPQQIVVNSTPAVEIADVSGVALATGSTTLSNTARHIFKVYVDDTGANRVMTIWLWNSSTNTWDEEATNTGGGAAASGWFSFGDPRTKSETASGTKFLTNLYGIDDSGSIENSDPTGSPVLMKGLRPEADGTTYSDFDGGAPSYLDVDELANDGTGTKDDSGTGTGLLQQTYHLDMHALGNDNTIPSGHEIAAISFWLIQKTASGANGDRDGIIRHLGSEVNFQKGVLANYADYNFDFDVREHRPSGYPWQPQDIYGTAAKTNQVELGLQRAAAGSDPRDLSLTMAFGVVVYRESVPIELRGPAPAVQDLLLPAAMQPEPSTVHLLTPVVAAATVSQVMII